MRSDVVGNIFLVDCQGDCLSVFTEESGHELKRRWVISRTSLVTPAQVDLSADQVVVLISARNQLQHSR